MPLDIYDLLLYFITYSFLGWCCESLYCSIGAWKWINRGFVNGPFCPVYGFGALFTSMGLQYLPNRTLPVFLGGMVITSTLEYITGWGMEKIFHARWWDYSKRRYNLHGRICLLNSTLFGFLCVFLRFDLHPVIEQFFRPFSVEYKQGFLAAFGIYFFSDLCLSIWSAFGLKLRLKALDHLRSELLAKYPILESKPTAAQLLEQLKNSGIQDELLDKFQKKERDIGMFEKRLLRSFPELSSRRYGDFLNELKENLKARKEKKKD